MMQYVAWNLLCVFVMLATGCADLNRDLSTAGKGPGYIACKGKATLTGTGNGAAVAVMGVMGGNSFSVTFDCGDGASLTQGMPVPQSQ